MSFKQAVPKLLHTAILLQSLPMISSQSPTTDNICEGLPQQECQRQYEMTSGDTLCAYNIVLDECYPITRSQGEHGNGNFDDGFQYALNETHDVSHEARVILVVCGTLSGLLLITLGLFIYYIWNWAPEIKRHLTEGTESTDDEEEDDHTQNDHDFISHSKTSIELHAVDKHCKLSKYSITATPIEMSGLTFASEGRIRSPRQSIFSEVTDHEARTPSEMR